MAKKFTILSKYENVTRVSDQINSYMVTNKVNKETADLFEMCLLEALNNIIKHAYKGDHTKEIHISVEVNDNKASVTLTDRGLPRKNVEKAKLEYDPKDIDNLPESGMGLFIIENIMDETHYQNTDSINTYKLVKYLK